MTTMDDYDAELYEDPLDACDVCKQLCDTYELRYEPEGTICNSCYRSGRWLDFIDDEPDED